MHCRFGLQYCWSTIIFVVHLAFADLLCCVINMPVNAYSNFSKGWYLGEKLCILFAAFRYILTYVDWMIVALIALSKCILLLKPRFGKMVFSGLSGHLIAISLWFIAILVILLQHFWVILNFEKEKSSSLWILSKGLGFRRIIKFKPDENEITSSFWL